MDPQWTAALYERHKTGIYRFALSILKSPACAEDVLQETFLRLLRADRVPFEPGREQAWLYRVARTFPSRSSPGMTTTAPWSCGCPPAPKPPTASSKPPNSSWR